MSEKQELQVINLTEHMLFESRERVARARPFLSIALYALEPKALPGLGTLAVSDKFDLLYDPGVEWKDSVLDAVLYHEISHLLLDHAGRFKSILKNQRALQACGISNPEDPLTQQSLMRIWNVAGDCEINDDIQDEGTWTLPKGVCYPDKLGLLRGQTAEVYFGELLKKAEKISIEVDNPSCGSCAGNPSEHEKEHEKEMSDWDKKAAQERAERIRQAVAEKITEEKEKQERQAQSRPQRNTRHLHGSAPGTSNIADHWVEWAKRRIKTSMAWKRFLAANVKRNIGRASGAVDYTMQRVSRRSPPGILLPGLLKPHPRICVVHDISGSMEGEPTLVSLNAIDEIINATGVSDVWVIPTNHIAHETVRVRRSCDVKYQFGGGTNMGAGIEAARELNPLPDLVVVVTDGETPWPDKNTFPYPVMAAIVELSNVSSYQVPKWIRTMKIYI